MRRLPLSLRALLVGVTGARPGAGRRVLVVLGLEVVDAHDEGARGRPRDEREGHRRSRLARHARRGPRRARRRPARRRRRRPSTRPSEQWEAIEGRIKKNDTDAYLEFEDALSDMRIGAQDKDATQGLEGRRQPRRDLRGLPGEVPRVSADRAATR